MSGLIIELVGIWATCGFLFWCDGFRHNGFPIAWKSKPRYEGWDTVLCIYLPFSLVLGPICWIVLLVYKLIEE